MQRRPRPTKLSIVLSCVGVVALASAVIPWLDLTGPIPQLQAGVAFVIAVLMAAAVVTAALRKWLVIPAFLLASIIWVIPLFAEPVGVPPLDHAPIKVLSANLHLGKAPLTQVATLIEQKNVDVAVLAETNPAYAKQLLDILSPKGYTLAAAPVKGGVDGTAIVTRLRSRPADSGEPSRFEQPAIEVQLRERWIRVRAVHTQNPLTDASGWRSELTALNKWVSAQPEEVPLVLAGDFNASSMHPGFRILSEPFEDATPRSGLFWQPTWPIGREYPPFASIDHILVRRGMAGESSTFQLTGSDHLGIVAVVYAKTS